MAIQQTCREARALLLSSRVPEKHMHNWKIDATLDKLDPFAGEEKFMIKQIMNYKQ